MSHKKLGAIALTTLSSIAACGEGGKGAKGPEGTAASSEPSASAKPEPPRAKVAPAPSNLSLGQFWPTKICTRGPDTIELVNSCVCDSRMTCSVTRRGSNVLDMHVVMSNAVCKDCGTFSARCTVSPDLRGKSIRIMIDGKPALDALDLPKGDAPRNTHCWD